MNCIKFYMPYSTFFATKVENKINIIFLINKVEFYIFLCYYDFDLLDRKILISNNIWR